VVKVDVPVRPQRALDLLTSDQFAGLIEEQAQQIKGLPAESDRLPSSAQTPSAIVEFEVSKPLHSRIELL